MKYFGEIRSSVTLACLSLIISACGPSGQILFQRDSTIYVANSDGTEVEEILADASGASWSVKSDLILLSRYRGTSAVHQHDLGSGETQRFTEKGLDPFRPVLSPDGELVAFSSFNFSCPQVFLTHRSESLEETRNGGQKVVVSIGCGDAPSWSPKGDKLAYASNGQIYVANSSNWFNSNLYEIGMKISGELEDAVWPSWSPDNDSVVFSAVAGGTHQIYRADIGRTNAGPSISVQRLTDGDVDATNPSWSWADNRIAFVRMLDEGPTIFTMKPDGSDVRDTGLRGGRPSYR